ncbi:phosphonate ABC transporter, permease protein PhnE [Bacillus sp. DTU_2020_1000418_1_SI_GHA_SEK_038]|uniref:phosphonate ABC transporter, permease protein PhnE n=1 Tax=Bacillus sp. DTU_2020_1000418_1_SI_GHA_SEK_038 TaxID=3077585 RepID=UPI0028E52F54|nr:phosphonate ABC transporter, permease protein PhnE [Bacillus sp. DTU_2020_1000418_1_SI_GHA_SEK_038]WNS75815.1 phosphonate ABC transporter, permease protein PhnE [Bacillus sp. DTU_2020_1000418_1_SI_GHA_SEK_038]
MLSQPQKKVLPEPPRKLKTYFTVFIIILLLSGSAIQTNSTITELIIGAPNMMELLAQMLPPNWSYFGKIVHPMLETIRMALIGTTFGAIIAIPIALFSASNIIRNTWFYYPVRFVLNLIRTIPDLLLAAIFVSIFGLGPLPGILALTIFSIGLVAKLTYEAIEAIDPGPLEAMTSVGANKVQWIFFGVLPQVLPYYISYVLYTFEVNVRAAAVLGLVGAGGIGLYYDRTLGFFEYDKTSSIIIFTLVVVLLIDYISTKLREKLI